MTGGIWPPYGHAHSFDAADLDVVSRRIWRHLGPSNVNPVYNFALGWFNIDTYQAGTVPGDIAFMDNWPTVSLLPESRLLYVVRPQSGGISKYSKVPYRPDGVGRTACRPYR